MMVVAEGAQSSVLLAELCVEYALTCATLSEVLPEDTELLDRARRELQRVEDLVNGGAIGVSPTRLERAREALKSHTT
jgi:hypothetical protein